MVYILIIPQGYRCYLTEHQETLFEISPNYQPFFESLQNVCTHTKHSQHDTTQESKLKIILAGILRAFTSENKLVNTFPIGIRS